MRYPKRTQYRYAKSQYRVRNWADYETGLRRRGALTVWLSDTALKAWRAPATGRPGGQRTYSDLAIEAAQTIRLAFHLPLRQPRRQHLHHRMSVHHPEHPPLASVPVSMTDLPIVGNMNPGGIAGDSIV